MNARETHKGTLNSCFVAFRNVWCIWDHFVTALNSMQTGQSDAINAKDRATNSRRIFSLRTHPIHTMGHKTHVLLHFRIVWVHLGSFRYCTKFGAKWAELGQWMKSLCHEVALEFFPMNAPDTHKGTLNSCFVAFRKVWVHLGSFRYCTKLGAKWAELVQ